MPETLALDAAATPAAQGLLARGIGVIFAPRKTYAAIARRPRVLGALALTVAIIAGATALFVNSEVGRQAVILPFLEENTFLARFLGSVDLLYLWLSVNLAIGLGVLYKRRTAPIAGGILAVYVVIALLIAAVRSALSGA